MFTSIGLMASGFILGVMYVGVIKPVWEDFKDYKKNK